MPNELERAYAALLAAFRQPRRKAELEAAVAVAIREVRAAAAILGVDLDAAHVGKDVSLAVRLPETVYVTSDRDTDGSDFLLAHELGVMHLPDGTQVGIYRRESLGRVKVTVELLTESHAATA